MSDNWKRIAKWMKNNYSGHQFNQSGQIAGNKYIIAEEAWRQFCLIPRDLLETPGEQTDPEIHKSINAFLLYHWDAGQVAGLSLGNGMSGQYIAGCTLLKSSLELILKGALSQCLSQREFRESPSPNLRPTDSLSMLASRLSGLIREATAEDSELKSNSFAIFNILRDDWMQYTFSLDINSIIQQLADWDILNPLGDNPANIVRSLHLKLSRNMHEIVEYTDAGRAIAEGQAIFEWPAPILAQSLSDFLEDFHSTMEIGVILILNLLALNIPTDRLLYKFKLLIDNETFKRAELGKATKLLMKWNS
jgi:hypothetical protein